MLDRVHIKAYLEDMVVVNKKIFICSVIARAILFICFIVALLALLWSIKNIYFYEFIGFSLVSITSLAVALFPSSLVKKLGLGIYRAICTLGALSVAIVAIHHSFVYDLPLINYIEDFVVIVCFVYMGFYTKAIMISSAG